MKKEIFNHYATKVADLFDVSEDDLFAPKRTMAISDARSLLYYLCYIRPMNVSYIKNIWRTEGLKYYIHLYSMALIM